MAKKIDLRKELEEQRYEWGLLQKIPCSKEDNKRYCQMLKDGESIPQGVYRYVDGAGVEMNSFYSIYQSDLTQEEQDELLKLEKLSMIRTIKNCAIFFVALTAISLLVYFLIAAQSCGSLRI